MLHHLGCPCNAAELPQAHLCLTSCHEHAGRDEDRPRFTSSDEWIVMSGTSHAARRDRCRMGSLELEERRTETY